MVPVTSRTEKEPVRARTSLREITTTARAHNVVAAVPTDEVTTLLGPHLIGSWTCADAIRSAPPANGVVAAARHDHVGAAGTCKVVRPGCADEGGGLPEARRARGSRTDRSAATQPQQGSRGQDSCTRGQQS
jgi:hypothetical protein